MATYEVEHNIPEPQTTSTSRHPPRRPDLSTFFSTLELVDTSGEQRSHNNSYAVPIPGDVSAAFRTLADAFERMRQDGGEENNLLQSLVETLMVDAERPPREVHGVPDSFLDGKLDQETLELERIPKKSLKPADVCPICNNPFLEDQYPLVVRLPCHKSHLFDLECIQPWLKLHPTCPLDRIDLLKKSEPPPASEKEEEEEDGEWDDMYA
ncbi:MAG: hypothetical protein M1830_008019 [Pleopsidium flavum]|nr:MAG: hypothetical protein M1830_008019 [Pleopsidium flavum]